jgi:hypothetical protein
MATDPQDPQSVEARKQRYQELLSQIEEKKTKIGDLTTKIKNLYKQVEEKEHQDDIDHIADLEDELENI